MSELNNVRIAVLATDGFEESELTEPVKALKAAGARVDVISLKPGQIQAFRHDEKSITVPVDRTLDSVRPEDYDGLLLPGGTMNADTIRVEPSVQQFVRAFAEAGKPMAAICHAPWVLVSAGLIKGRTLTSYKTIQDDIRNAGGNWIDREVVVDGMLVTSRQPSDIPAFNRELISLLKQVAPVGVS